MRRFSSHRIFIHHILQHACSTKEHVALLTVFMSCPMHTQVPAVLLFSFCLSFFLLPPPCRLFPFSMRERVVYMPAHELVYIVRSMTTSNSEKLCHTAQVMSKKEQMVCIFFMPAHRFQEV